MARREALDARGRIVYRSTLIAGIVALALVGVAVGVGAVFALQGGDVDAASVPPPIAFASDRGGIDAIYVVDPDGTHLRTLIANGNEPRWSPDGSHIAFRRGDDDALFVAGARGHVIRRLVASYDAYAWAPDGTRILSEAQGGLVVVRLDGRRTRVTRGSDSSPSWSPDGKLVAFVREEGDKSKLLVTDGRTQNAVDSIAADGPRVAIAYASSPNCIELWTPSTRRLLRFAENACAVTAEGGEATGIAGLGLAGRRVAWTNWMETNHYATWVVTAAELRPAPVSVFEVEDDAYAGPPFGDGALLVFESWRDDRRGTIRKLDRGRVAVVARTTGAPALLAVGGGLVVRRHDRSTIDVLRANGTAVAPFRAAARISAAAVDHGVVAVQSGRTLSAYDVRTRRPVARRPIGARESLLDLDDGIALLVAGRTLRLLRLSDGADATIHVPGGARVNAQLEPAGLYYSFAASVAFVPRGVLLRRLPG